MNAQELKCTCGWTPQATRSHGVYEIACLNSECRHYGFPVSETSSGEAIHSWNNMPKDNMQKDNKNEKSK